MAKQSKPTDHALQREVFGAALWTPEEVAPLYGVAPETLKNWLRTGRVASVRLGRQWYVPDQAIRKSIQSALQEAGLAPRTPGRKKRPAAVDTLPHPLLSEAEASVRLDGETHVYDPDQPPTPATAKLL